MAVSLYYYVRAEVTNGIILPYVLCVNHRQLSMKHRQGKFSPTQLKESHASTILEGDGLNRVCLPTVMGAFCTALKCTPDNTMRETKQHSDYMGNYSPLMILIV